MSTAVREILQRIEALSEDDREAFAREWAAREEREWRSLALAARAEAAGEGLDDAAIARAVEADRYGGGAQNRGTARVA